MNTFTATLFFQGNYERTLYCTMGFKYSDHRIIERRWPSTYPVIIRFTLHFLYSGSETELVTTGITVSDCIGYLQGIYTIMKDFAENEWKPNSTLHLLKVWLALWHTWLLTTIHSIFSWVWLAFHEWNCFNNETQNSFMNQQNKFQCFSYNPIYI